MSLNFNEKGLIEKAKAGCDESFEILITGCKTKAYNTALRFLRDEDDAMDALQESLIKVFRHLEQFKGDCKFDTWVYRIVVNTCYDILRKKQKEKNVYSINVLKDDEDTTIDITDDSPTPEEILDINEKTNHVLECLNMMSLEHREVIILRDIQGFTYDEISQILECSVGTVKSRLNRARQRLRNKLMEQNDFIYV
ncbi:MAG: sigma-70 family RNA polymerase sigma factor [Clostridiales bacterium]|jgi:RNA polymerase sigma-70 factor (ECF subfamily)|nr:sigma-70 family RNA polymerase sigma factor [Clostridiales bacterium]